MPTLYGMLGFKKSLSTQGVWKIGSGRAERLFLEKALPQAGPAAWFEIQQVTIMFYFQHSADGQFNAQRHTYIIRIFKMFAYC